MFPRITLRAASFAAILVVLLAGCGKQNASSTSSPLAARVNGDEISEQQVNQVTARLGQVAPEQALAASKQAVEQLIDQQLLVQKAVETKLDRDPEVMNKLEAARRQILAQAFVEKLVTSGAPKVAAEEIRKFYDARPELFGERRVYRIQELAVKVTPEQLPALREQVASAKGLDEIAAWLRSGNIPFNPNAAVRAAEQLPLGALPRLSKMKDGEIILMQNQGQATVLQLAASQLAPMTVEEATPQIEAYLLNQKKADMTVAEVKQLRQSAKLAYEGRFAEAATAPGAAVPQGTAPVGAVADRKEQQAKN
jgi:EpsD family peptidyl-prolyl cis-trans isomerase